LNITVDTLADHLDVEAVPLAEGLVHELGGFLPSSFLLFQRPPEALVNAPSLNFVLLRVVPDLHLRDAAQVDAAVAERQHLVIDHQLEVAVVFVGGEVQAFAVVDELAVLHLPVRVDVIALVVALGIHRPPSMDFFL
jgi:hypothetical protein